MNLFGSRLQKIGPSVILSEPAQLGLEWPGIPTADSRDSKAADAEHARPKLFRKKTLKERGHLMFQASCKKIGLPV
jgi:hypothetical protein